MTITRKIAAATATAALAATGVASAAQAPVVSAQKTVHAHRAPVTIPGTGVKKHGRIPRGDRIVYRKVTLEAGSTVNVTMRAPRHKRLRGLAMSDGELGSVVISDVHYVGHTRVRSRMYTAPKATGEVTGRIYALVG